MEMVRRDQKTLASAAVELGVSYRQAERIYKRYKEGGDEALIHGNTGKQSNHKTDEKLVEKALELYQTYYYDFGPTFAAEKMGEREKLIIGVSTLRRALIEAGLWEKARNHSQYRSRRIPRKQFGELIQFDGSPHDWFEGRR